MLLGSALLEGELDGLVEGELDGLVEGELDGMIPQPQAVFMAEVPHAIIIHFRGGLPLPLLPGRYSACSPACFGSLLRLFVTVSLGHLAIGSSRHTRRNVPRVVSTSPTRQWATGSRSLLHHGDGVAGC
jgi:hypothetical protein